MSGMWKIHHSDKRDDMVSSYALDKEAVVRSVTDSTFHCDSCGNWASTQNSLTSGTEGNCLVRTLEWNDREGCLSISRMHTCSVRPQSLGIQILCNGWSDCSADVGHR